MKLNPPSLNFKIVVLILLLQPIFFALLFTFICVSPFVLVYFVTKKYFDYKLDLQDIKTELEYRKKKKEQKQSIPNSIFDINRINIKT